MHAGSLDPRSLPWQEVRDCQNAAQDQPKTARKRPKRRQEGPKRAPRRAQKAPKTGPRRPRRASGRPKRQHLRVGRQPRPSSGENRPGSGLFWGPFWGPSWAPNRPKLAPERVQKRRRNLHAEKYPRGTRKSAIRGVRATPGEAKIIEQLMCFTMFLKFPVCTRSCAEEARLRAPGADFGGQEGAPTGPKWSQHASRKRLQNDLRIDLVLEAVWEPS